ncbi:MAG: hypothetical protein HQ464_02630 [Planctomycetes bacterium]|nr:hypothetical protein [Planctomycetota bacterium]
MPRSDYRIEKGQKLSSAISAAGWNRTQEAADIVLNTRGGQAAGDPRDFDRAANLVLIKNTTAHTVPRFGVLGIDGVEIDPSGGTITGTNAASIRAREFARRPVLRGVTPRSVVDTDRFAVFVEPVQAGDIARAAVSGAFACLVNVLDTSHRFATIKDGDREQLESTACGVLQLIWKESGAGPKKWAVGVM